MSPELHKASRSTSSPRRAASLRAPRTARWPQASEGPIAASSSASIAAAVRCVMPGCGAVVLEMRQVAADDKQRIIGPNPGDCCRNRGSRCRPEQQRHDRQIAEDRLQERQLHLYRMLGRVRLIVDETRVSSLSASTAATSTGTSPSGVANAVSEGAAMPGTGTKCAGPMTTARLIQPQHRTLAKAAAATRPEYAYPACGAMMPQCC